MERVAVSQVRVLLRALVHGFPRYCGASAKIVFYFAEASAIDWNWTSGKMILGKRDLIINMIPFGADWMSNA